MTKKKETEVKAAPGVETPAAETPATRKTKETVLTDKTREGLFAQLKKLKGENPKAVIAAGPVGQRADKTFVISVTIN